MEMPEYSLGLFKNSAISQAKDNPVARPSTAPENTKLGTNTAKSKYLSESVEMGEYN